MSSKDRRGDQEQEDQRHVLFLIKMFLLIWHSSVSYVNISEDVTEEFTDTEMNNVRLMTTFLVSAFSLIFQKSVSSI